VISQIAILVLGVTALWMTQTSKYAKYACFIGLLSQPFWFYASYTAGQWGVFIASIGYTGAWLKGLWTHGWIK